MILAGATRIELATSGVTGRRSNQLNYAPNLIPPSLTLPLKGGGVGVGEIEF
jgi:hypothetical protein